MRYLGTFCRYSGMGKNAEWVVWGFLFFWPLFDTLNGFLDFYSLQAPSVSALYKVLLLLVLCLWGFVFRFKVDTCVKAVVSGALVLLAVHILSNNADRQTLAWLVRLLLCCAIFVFLRNADQSSVKFRVISVCAFYLFVAGANVVFGNIGFGASQYSGGVGGKGFYIAGNELAFFILCSFSCLVFLISRKKYSLFYLGVCLVMLAPIAAWQGTKVLLGGFLIVCIMLPLLYVKKSSSLIKSSALSVFSVVAVAFLFLSSSYIPKFDINDRVYGFLSNNSVGQYEIMASLCDADFSLAYGCGEYEGMNGESSAIGSGGASMSHDKSGAASDRWSHFLKEKGVLFLVFSGRLEFWELAKEKLVDDFGVLDYVFGAGELAFELDRVEIDVLDIFLAYGLLGVVVFYLMFVKALGASSRFWSVDKGKCVFLVGVMFMFLGVSVFAGHVVNSGVSSSIIAIMWYLVIWDAHDGKEEKSGG